MPVVRSRPDRTDVLDASPLRSVSRSPHSHVTSTTSKNLLGTRHGLLDSWTVSWTTYGPPYQVNLQTHRGHCTDNDESLLLGQSTGCRKEPYHTRYRAPNPLRPTLRPYRGTPLYHPSSTKGFTTTGGQGWPREPPSGFKHQAQTSHRQKGGAQTSKNPETGNRPWPVCP